MNLIWAWLLLTAVVAKIGNAAPPPNLTPDSVVVEWFKSLKQPATNLPCCGISDCRSVSYRMTAKGSYEVYVEGSWYAVPEETIVRRGTNPIGHAVACYRQNFGYSTLPGVSSADRVDTIELLCFVPPRATS
jgi:hypothetical protein